MKTRWFVSLLVTLSAVAAPSFAGDTSNYKFLGFSSDLKYCAFEVFGVEDGSGFPYATVYYITVDINDYAAAPVGALGKNEESLEEIQAKAEKQAAASVKGIAVSESNVGAVTELSGDHVLSAALQLGHRAGTLQLAENSAGQDPDSLEDQKMFELDLLLDGKVQVLQKDASLPKGRKGVYKYSLRAAYVNGDKVAVFIDYQKPGFEGADTRQMIVTAALPKP